MQAWGVDSLKPSHEDCVFLLDSSGEEQRCQYGHDGHGEDECCGEGRHERESHWAEHLTLHTLQAKDRDEDDDDDQSREENRLTDFYGSCFEGG